MTKKTWGILLGTILVTIVYFSYNITLGYDSSQYVWLATMFTDQLDFANWEPVRSFIFPLGIHILNTVFGRNETSLLIGTYIFYLTMVFATWYMYHNTIQKNEQNKFIKAMMIIMFVILVMFNPIIFGFYHVLLTEFASITIAILMCYLSWRWIEIQFKENKLKYIVYTIVFAILTVCSWHLKQPYILTSMVPLVIAIILSVIKDHSKRNIFQRMVVLLICILSLVISMIGWNTVLKLKYVKVDTSKSSGGLLGRNILEGVTEYREDPNEENYTKESIEKDTRIKQADKEKILSIINNQSEEYKGFILLDHGTYMNPQGDRKVIYTKEKNISIGEALGFIKDTLFSEPKVLFSSYLSNYLAIIDIYDVGVKIDYGNYYYINKEFHWSQDTEITFLGYCIYRDNWNSLDLPDHYIEYSRDYISVNKYIRCINYYMVKMMLPAKILFKMIMLVLPILAIIKLISYFVTSKKYNQEYKRINQLIIILYMYALAQMTMYVLLGSLMDRYAVAPYTATLIAALLHGYTILRRKKYKENTDIKEKNNEKNIGETRK